MNEFETKSTIDNFINIHGAAAYMKLVHFAEYLHSVNLSIERVEKSDIAKLLGIDKEFI